MTSYDYRTKTPENMAACLEWSFTSFRDCDTSVLPDGCRDVIVRATYEERPICFVSDLNDSAYTVSTKARTHMKGIRLRPGVNIQQDRLNAWLCNKSIDQLFASDQINEFCEESESLSEILSGLASKENSIACVAANLGVSVRSMQRLVSQETGKSPYFWFSLARARRTCRMLLRDERLCDVSVENGFSDQPHMTREMKKWFNLTPLQIRSNPNLSDLLSEPGYG